ncbi:MULTISPECIES: hypothetical protein [Oceanicaulis]|nr:MULTISPECIES: hypothetical protein [Oceanicaulis]|tara:strand:- start:270 stop:410 length:141 start_codon:yes stop_codon:yes gene_type:complete
MTDNLASLIYSLTPEDGSSIGNGAMIALRLQAPYRLPEIGEFLRDL